MNPVNRPPRILVVEDDRDIAGLVRRYLDRAGFQTELFYSGREGLAAITQQPPDLIVLDMAMPGMDGRQFLYHLRRDTRWADVPVIITTGRLAEEFESLATDSVDVLAKPFSDATLIERVRRLVGEPEPRAVVKT